ncbi:MAG: bifunctional oligoribonuclease/PAP phosphatase NrnA [Gammaproteobacteria bacterium]|nr:bifunctional oligoribonuclease/PAP phosphatase NrnA [Gammaproteobacteria bacterium]
MENNKKVFNEILQTIKDYKKIIIIRHKGPDYDAYGSQFGLYYALKENFKDKEILIVGDDNANNFYNRPMDDVKEEDYNGALLILVDQSSVGMLNDLNYRFADKIIIMDHHESNPDFGDIVIITPTYSSAAELITEFLYETNLTIPKVSADALYIGMVGDSNRFFYKGTTSNTFLMAKVLLDAGADIITDYKLMVKDESEGFKKIKGYVLENFTLNNKVASVVIPKEIRNKYGITDAQASRGTINMLATLENCEAWVNFTEKDDGEAFVEIRSKEISVVDVAKSFGGGGHELACGATIATLDLKDEFVRRLEEKVN